MGAHRRGGNVSGTGCLRGGALRGPRYKVAASITVDSTIFQQQSIAFLNGDAGIVYSTSSRSRVALDDATAAAEDETVVAFSGPRFSIARVNSKSGAVVQYALTYSVDKHVTCCAVSACGSMIALGLDGRHVEVWMVYAIGRERLGCARVAAYRAEKRTTALLFVHGVPSRPQYDSDKFVGEVFIRDESTGELQISRQRTAVVKSCEEGANKKEVLTRAPAEEAASAAVDALVGRANSAATEPAQGGDDPEELWSFYWGENGDSAADSLSQCAAQLSASNLVLLCGSQAGEVIGLPIASIIGAASAHDHASSTGASEGSPPVLFVLSQVAGITSLVQSPDGTRLIVGSHEGVRIVQYPASECIERFIGTDVVVDCEVVLTPGGFLLLVLEYSRLLLIDPETSAVLCTLSMHHSMKVSGGDFTDGQEVDVALLPKVLGADEGIKAPDSDCYQLCGLMSRFPVTAGISLTVQSVANGQLRIGVQVSPSCCMLVTLCESTDGSSWEMRRSSEDGGIQIFCATVASEGSVPSLEWRGSSGRRIL